MQIFEHLSINPFEPRNCLTGVHSTKITLQFKLASSHRSHVSLDVSYGGFISLAEHLQVGGSSASIHSSVTKGASFHCRDVPLLEIALAGSLRTFQHLRNKLSRNFDGYSIWVRHTSWKRTSFLINLLARLLRRGLDCLAGGLSLKTIIAVMRSFTISICRHSDYIRPNSGNKSVALILLGSFGTAYLRTLKLTAGGALRIAALCQLRPSQLAYLRGIQVSACQALSKLSL